MPDDEAESVVNSIVNSDGSLNRSIIDFRASKQEFDLTKMRQEVPELTPERKEIIRMMLMQR